MTKSTDISREDWLKDMETKSPSSQALEAYVAVETFVVGQTPLEVTYRRGPGGHATFCGSAAGPGRRCCIIQILRGHCEIMGQWRNEIPGLSEEQHLRVNGALNRLRKAIDGSPNKGFQQIKVLRLGIERVNSALLEAANELVKLMNDS